MKWKKYIADRRVITFLWVVASTFPVIRNTIEGRTNNYLIFRGVFWHTWERLPLYTEYPKEYFDVNHYGVLFSALIAPFAILPNEIGIVLWCWCNALFLGVALWNLPLKRSAILIIMWICVHELYGASAMMQFNTSIAALVIMTFVSIERKNEKMATASIVLGTLTKIYGIVGCTFFFFSSNKMKFIVSGLIFLLLGIVIPMCYSSPEYVLHQYQGWYESIAEKNGHNLWAEYQNISFLGFLRKTGLYVAKDIWVILCGLILFALPYLRINQYKSQLFRMQFLASVLLFIVLFSTGSESSTYIIAYAGIGIWYVSSPSPYRKWKNFLLILAIMASFSGTDIVPPDIKKEYVVKYALRSIPSFLIWVNLIVEMCTLNYQTKKMLK